jgi:hypothetical protein
MSAPDACPVCGQGLAVSKVSAVYIAGLQAGKKAAAERADAPVKVRGLSADLLPALSRRLAPPASRKEAQLRLVHPDLVVLAFSLIAPVFLAGIYRGQPPFFYPVSLGLALAYGVYFWQRRRILARFERQMAAERKKQEHIRHAIQRWMNLYYCAKDDIIFEPGGAPPLPADQIHGYLFQD